MLVTRCCCGYWPTSWQKTTGAEQVSARGHGAAANVNAALAKLPNQIYGGGYDHHPRRDDETLLYPVHDYAPPNRNNIIRF
jgi:cell wall-associated NlpC family hydrolase